METHMEGKIYGDSYRRYKVWRPVEGFNCMETRIEHAMHGNSYRGYNVWILI